MPNFNQPPSLRDIAVGKLARSVGKHCAHLVDRVNKSNLKQDLNLLKSEICTLVPAPVFDKFTAIMLQEITKLLGDRSEWIPEGIIDNLLDLVTDERLSRLEYFPGVSGKLMYGLTRSFAKLNGVKTADLSTFLLLSSAVLPPLRNLTSLTYREHCADEFLEVVGHNCLQLTHLDVSLSRVTDRGICSMRRCSMLSVVQFRKSHVTSEGILELLTTHTKIVDLGRFDGLYGCSPRYILERIPNENKNLRYFDMWVKDLDDLKLLSIKCPRLSSAAFRFEHRLLVSFLTSGENRTSDFVDYSVLEEFRELKQIECHSILFVEIFLRFLPFNASRITKLDLGWPEAQKFGLNMSKLNAVNKACVNLEWFKFAFSRYSYERDLTELNLPPFPKIKTLKILAVDGVFSSKMKLNLNTLKHLEILCYLGFRISLSSMLFIVRDSDNLPKLSTVITDDLVGSVANKIMRYARKLNLNFTIKTYKPEV